MVGKVTLVALISALLLGCAHETPSNPIGSAFAQCVGDEAKKQAEKQGIDQNAPPPDGVDAPGGPCEAQRQAYSEDLRRRDPAVSEQQRNKTLDDTRNTAWLLTMFALATPAIQ
jgi:hypothetical protein